MAAVAVAQDPIPTLYARYGDAVAEALHRAQLLQDSLRELDKLDAQLADYNLAASADLGPVGNAAKAAYRDAEDHREVHAKDIFEMPFDRIGVDRV